MKRHKIKISRYIWAVLLFYPFLLNVFINKITDPNKNLLTFKNLKFLILNCYTSQHFGVIFFYIFICNEIKLRFSDLNKSFISFLKSSYKYSPDNFLQRAYENYRLMHYMLTNDCVHLINKIFGSLIIFAYAKLVLELCMIFYNFRLADTPNFIKIKLPLLVNCGFIFITPILIDELTNEVRSC